MPKEVSPGVLALRKVVDDVYADARDGRLLGTATLPVTNGQLALPVTQDTFKYLLKK